LIAEQRQWVRKRGEGGGGGFDTGPVACGAVRIGEEVVGLQRPGVVEGVLGVHVRLGRGVQGVHAAVQVDVVDQLVHVLVPA